MDKIPESIQTIILDYVRKINSKIPVKKAILFGSYAKGSFDDDSDIDIAIFSNYFQGMSGKDAFKLLFMNTLSYGVDLEPQAFLEEEYVSPLGLTEEIIKTGIEIPLQ